MTLQSRPQAIDQQWQTDFIYFQTGISLKTASIWSRVEHNFKTFVQPLATCHFFFFWITANIFFFYHHKLLSEERATFPHNKKKSQEHSTESWPNLNTTHKLSIVRLNSSSDIVLSEMESLWISCCARILSALLWKPFWKRASLLRPQRRPEQKLKT